MPWSCPRAFPTRPPANSYDTNGDGKVSFEEIMETDERLRKEEEAGQHADL